MIAIGKNPSSWTRRRRTEYIIGIGWLIGMVVMLVLLMPTQQAHGDSGKRMDAVHKLLEESSAAKRVAASANDKVKTMYEKARKLYEEARQAYDSGDSARGEERLNEAVSEMTRAVQLAGSGESKTRKQEGVYQTRLNSVESLLKAYKRIVEEKSIQASADVSETVQAHIGKASSYKESGELPQAQQQLELGYRIVTEELERLRQGETLVRSLNFANKEEEYEYELDRNDTHKMLIEVLLNEQSKGKQMASSFIEKAASLRVAAENYSSQGKFEQAIKTIEESTKNLVRAIRSSGVYIPG